MLDYTNIFAVFVDLIQNAIPIGVFFWLVNIIINFFLSLAFPSLSRFKRGDF